jgi:serine/threonine protein kinase
LKDEELGSSSNVSMNGGTRCYQAPELWDPNAKFNSKADVFAAGVVFLEMISLLPPNTLYFDLWPKVLDLDMPPVLSMSLSDTLQKDPLFRKTFEELFVLLSSKEAKEISEQDNEEHNEEFFDVSGRVLDFISHSRNNEESESQTRRPF